MDPATTGQRQRMKIATEEIRVDVSLSVESSDPKERVAARRLRVRAKLEARKGTHMNQHHVQPRTELEEKRSWSQQQLEASEQRLFRLSWDGAELVTNVERALMSREAERRQQEAQARRDRIEKLQAEAQEGQEHFEMISRTWCASETSNVPHELHGALCNQQQECLKFIGRKNHVIDELRQELNMRDESCVQCLKQQAEDITLIIERAEHRTQDMMFAQQEELENIEKAFEKERQDVLLANKQEWEQRMKSLKKCEEEHTRKLARHAEEHQQAMDELRYEEFEDLAEARTRLLTNIQVLEEQMQQIQVEFQMNQDKLDYNLYVLQKQDQENNVICSQQKRKSNRQYDVLNKLRKTLEKQHHNVQQAICVLNHDVQLLTEQQEDLQHKMRHFAIVDSENFCKAWLTAEEECQSMAHSTLRVHHLLNEWVLGLPCVDVQTSCLENRGPFGKFVVPCSATSLVHRLLTTGLQREGSTMSAAPGQTEDPSSSFKTNKDEVAQEETASSSTLVSPRTLKHILEILCDETQEFLVDSKLLGLLAPLPHTQQCLLKLDTIFKALGVDTEEDVNKLAKFLLDYQKATSTQLHDKEEALRVTKTDGEFKGVADLLEEPFIDPNIILQALKVFASQHCHPDRNLHAEGAPVPPKWSQRDSSRDCLYWQSLADVVPPAQLRIWDVLTSTLRKYRNMLTYRLNLIKENATTQQQNEELQRLLAQYNMDKGNVDSIIAPLHRL